jgi:hypothetical protein
MQRPAVQDRISGSLIDTVNANAQYEGIEDTAVRNEDKPIQRQYEANVAKHHTYVFKLGRALYFSQYPCKYGMLKLQEDCV